jgi:hypothetical protein
MEVTGAASIILSVTCTRCGRDAICLAPLGYLISVVPAVRKPPKSMKNLQYSPSDVACANNDHESVMLHCVMFDIALHNDGSICGGVNMAPRPETRRVQSQQWRGK